jgi:hypothetical protein
MFTNFSLTAENGCGASRTGNSSVGSGNGNEKD